MNSTATIWSRLSADATLIAALATYGTGPAIFNEKAPTGFVFATGVKPCLIIAAPSNDQGAETFTENGRAIQQDVRGYAFDTGSSAALDTIMRRVRTLFHNAPGSLTVTGGKAILSRVTGPVASPTSEASVIGRRVTISLELQNT
ncbi:MAG: hypothetical protein ACK4FB_08160 [Brevundimonas sp.]|uniref:hypothetical protein n=1 Tax=Brevundimonas sp. TaxID=1871086 RepID=UPI00391B26F2